MRYYPEVVELDTVPWRPSPTGAPGCHGKPIFEYDPRGLARDGATESYTILYRLDPGAAYPPWRMLQGCLELWLIEGSLEVNGRSFEAGVWLRFPTSSSPWQVSSREGAQMLIVVRGLIALTDS